MSEGETAFEAIIPNPKNAQGAAVTAVHQIALIPLDDGSPGSHMPHIEQGKRQEQTQQALPIANMCFVQVETVALQVAMHFFSPHTATVSL